MEIHAQDREKENSEERGEIQGVRAADEQLRNLQQ